MVDTVTTTFVAIEDPPEIQRLNPIHAEGATAYGYERAIVAGLSSYGWAAAALIELLGEGWLDLGWADMAFRRPVIAGDELTPRSDEAMIATGFLRLGPEGGGTRLDAVDDPITTTTLTFTGLTVGCARCHNRKFDAIPQKDYYRIQ